MQLTHNQITLNQLENFVDKGRDCCVVNPCGSGKTSVMTDFLKNHPDKKTVILTKQVNAKKYYEEKDCVFLNTKIKTYSMMLSDYRNGRMDDYNINFLIVDEAHYIGANKWNEAFSYIKERFHPIVIGFTATPQRFEDQGTDETIVTEYFDGNSAGNFTTKQLQRQGVFKEPEYILSLYNLESEIEDRLEKLDDADLPEQKTYELKNRLYNIFSDWKKTACPEVVLKEALPRYMYKNSSNRILVYMPSIAEIDSQRSEIDGLIKKIFPNRKIVSYRYTYMDTEEDLSLFLNEDDDVYVKVLYSVDKIMETIHIDDLNILLMLRPSVSNRIITQQFGRINSIGNDKKPLVVDMVGNLNNINSVNFLSAGNGAKHINTGENNTNFNVFYITKYAGLFASIDSIFSRTVYYTYKGVTESLYNLCRIFNRDFHEVRKYVREEKMDVEQAFSIARKTGKPQLTDDIINGTYTFPEFSLTDEQKKLVTENMSIIDRYIKRKNIKDEDIIQNLYMSLMYTISQIEDIAAAREHINHMILTRAKTTYIKSLRMKYIREEMFCEDNIITMPLYRDFNCDKRLVVEELKKKLSTVIKTLSTREQIVIKYRFQDNLTLEEIAKNLGVTRERIRQIENKAIRKLRHPARYHAMGIRKCHDVDELLGCFDERSVYEAS